MNMKQAKKSILEAYSSILNTKLAASIIIESYLIAGVKVGKITAEQAAITIHNRNTDTCSNTFNSAQ